MSRREDDVIKATALLTAALRDAEEREGVPERDRVKPIDIAEHVADLFRLARKAQRANEDLTADSPQALTAPRRQAKIGEALRIHAAFFGVRITMNGEPRGFPLIISGDRLRGASNSFGHEGWGIAP